MAKVRTTLTIDDSVMKAVKVSAARTGRQGAAARSDRLTT
jgi:hypothetical protein